jgi:hypothetical protein
MPAAKTALTAAGQTGNNTHAGVLAPRAGDGRIAFEFVVEAVGATPTVTFKYQGSMDGSNWFDIFYVTDASDTPSAATRVVTAVGRSLQWLSLAGLVRFFAYYRLVTTSNTNVTYSANIHQS